MSDGFVLLVHPPIPKVRSLWFPHLAMALKYANHFREHGTVDGVLITDMNHKTVFEWPLGSWQ